MREIYILKKLEENDDYVGRLTERDEERDPEFYQRHANDPSHFISMQYFSSQGPCEAARKRIPSELRPETRAVLVNLNPAVPEAMSIDWLVARLNNRSSRINTIEEAVAAVNQLVNRVNELALKTESLRKLSPSPDNSDGKDNSGAAAANNRRPGPA